MKDQGFMELLLKVYRTGEPFHGIEIPAEFNEGNGTRRIMYFNFTYQPYREINGNITGVLVTATDVTGHVKAKQLLVDSEKRLRNIVLQAPVAMCILLGPDHVIEIANEAMIQLWGNRQMK
jgi:PAS domain-containing protein